MRRTGFLMRGFLPLGPLVASFGYGGFEDGVIPTAAEPVDGPQTSLLPPQGIVEVAKKPKIVTGKRRKRS